MKKSEREATAHEKAEKDLARATEVTDVRIGISGSTVANFEPQEYHAADAHLREHLPPVISATFSILPHLLAAQVLIQNNLLAQLYTAIHNYCTDEGFPSPAPPMEEVIAEWDASFKPLQRELESGITVIAQGKAVHRPMKLEDQTKNGIRNGFGRRASSQTTATSNKLPPPPSPAMSGTSPTLTSKPSFGRTPSPSNAISSPPAYSQNAADTLSPDHSYGAGGAHSPAAPRTDYFSRDRRPSGYSETSSTSAISPGAAAALGGKKRPPPPPPPKKEYVTALYDFGGQSAGDLVFREGDRIKVVKKTNSTDDWWEGELNGVKGAFPANYCSVG